MLIYTFTITNQKTYQMSFYATQHNDGKETNSQYFENEPSNKKHQAKYRSRLQTVTSDILKHYRSFRNLKRMLTWIIGMILFTGVAVFIYERWF
jgi:hypothetical protein